MSKKLKFKAKLLPAPGKPISAADLNRRLTELHEELAKFEQEDVDVESLASVTRDLVSPSLVTHKDKGVKALTACCIADILRLYAPDAPYSNSELREIFEFFRRQLLNIADIEGPYFQKYFYLVENLSTVKSIVLVADIQRGQDDLVADFFKDFFETIKPEHSKNCAVCMTDLLQQIVEECASLPVEAIDVLANQFSPKRQKENAAAFRMAVDLCKGTSDQLQRYFCTHFSDTILSAKEDDNYEEVQAQHDLIVEINKHAPTALDRVIPVLENELMFQDTKIREIATTTFSALFAEKGSQLVKSFPGAWKKWLNREKDKEVAIRVKLIEGCAPIYKSHPEFAAELDEVLAHKIRDPDDKVRTAVIRTIASLHPSVVSFVGTEVLTELSERCKDKKGSVRQEAIKALAKLYANANGEGATAIASAAEKFDFIPTHLMHAVYLNDPEALAAIERTLHEDIFPPDANDQSRTERLLSIVSTFDDKAFKAFISLIARRSTWTDNVKALIDLSTSYNGGVIDGDEEEITKNLSAIHSYIADRTTDPKRTLASLEKFSSLNDSRLYKLLLSVLDVKTEYKILLKDLRELQKRMEGVSSTLWDTFANLLRKTSLTILHRSSIPIIMERIKAGADSKAKAQRALGDAAQKLLKSISDYLPMLYKGNAKQFLDFLQSSDAILATDTLEALAQTAKTDQENVPQDKKSQNRLVKYALEGNEAQAKHAVIVLSRMNDKDKVCGDLLETLVGKLDREDEALPSRLSALNQLALQLPYVFEMQREAILSFIVKEVLLSPSGPEDSADSQESGQDWVDYSDLSPFIRSKILAVKLLISRIIPLARDGDESFRDGAKSVFKLLWKILDLDGELLSQGSSSAVCRAHLRLTAARGLLKLAKASNPLDEMITQHDFLKLALVIQDSCYQVREAFGNRLIKYIQVGGLPMRYSVILMLSAHEPEAELKHRIKLHLLRRAKAMRIEHEKDSSADLFELSYVRVLHLLAHHPDFGTDLESLQLFSKYIEFFLETVATAENISYLYIVSGQLKVVRDNLSESSENLYVLSELSQYLIRDKSHQLGWSLESHELSLRMPKSLFKQLSSKAAADNVRKTYLRPEFEEWMKSLREPKPDPSRLKKRASGAGLAGDEVDFTPAKKNAKASRRRSAGRESDDDDDEAVAEPSPPIRRNAGRRARGKTLAEGSSEDEEDAPMSDVAVDAEAEPAEPAPEMDTESAEPSAALPRKRGRKVEETSEKERVEEPEGGKARRSKRR
ncbi:armadillo-type protein [Hyaloraphidium curvatum]|nr:armadillo-type protein [Hyaloraphidium curvatum]